MVTRPTTHRSNVASSRNDLSRILADADGWKDARALLQSLGRYGEASAAYAKATTLKPVTQTFGPTMLLRGDGKRTKSSRVNPLN